MQSRTKLVFAILGIVIVSVVVFFTVPGVKAAFQRWFGYIPGVGLVEEGQILFLDEPVAVTREGVTLTVEQAVLNQDETVLLYSVEGVSESAWDTPLEEPLCQYDVSLKFTDNEAVLSSPQGVRSWATGYQHRITFPPMPAEIHDAKLTISCLFNSIIGSAPENWEIPLHFVPPPEDIQILPVIEISTPTATAEIATPEASSVDESSENSYEINLTIDRTVQMEDGYLLYATLNWDDTPFAQVDIDNQGKGLLLLDGNGQELPYTLHWDEQTGVKWDLKQTVFAIKTAQLQSGDPLTLQLDSVEIIMPAEASFVFDPGPNPQPGQQWQPDLEVTIGDHSLRVTSVVADASGYSFEMSSDTGILQASLSDYEHPIVSGMDGRGNEKVFFSGFNYMDGLPEGPVTISIGSITLQNNEKLEVKWTPPAASN